MYLRSSEEYHFKPNIHSSQVLQLTVLLIVDSSFDYFLWISIKLKKKGEKCPSVFSSQHLRWCPQMSCFVHSPNIECTVVEKGRNQKITTSNKQEWENFEFFLAPNIQTDESIIMIGELVRRQPLINCQCLLFILISVLDPHFSAALDVIVENG